MAHPARLVLLGALVVMTPFLAGCDFQDWYNQQGYLKVYLDPQGTHNTSLADFRSLKLAIFGVSVKQVLVVDTKEFSFGDHPLVVDLVADGVKGKRTQLVNIKENIRPVQSVTLKLDVVEAIDAQGKSIPVCREGQTAPSYPCFFLDANGFIRFSDRAVPIARGGTTALTFPIAVKSVAVTGKTEYFLETNQSLATIANE